MTAHARSDPLHQLRWTAMAKAWAQPRHDPAWAGLDCDNRFALLVDAAGTARRFSGAPAARPRADTATGSGMTAAPGCWPRALSPRRRTAGSRGGGPSVCGPAGSSMTGASVPGLQRRAMISSRSWTTAPHHGPPPSPPQPPSRRGTLSSPTPPSGKPFWTAWSITLIKSRSRASRCARSCRRPRGPR